jgi:hypothetical protein
MGLQNPFGKHKERYKYGWWTDRFDARLFLVHSYSWLRSFRGFII